VAVCVDLCGSIPMTIMVYGFRRKERPHRRLSSEVSLERASGVAGWFPSAIFLSYSARPVVDRGVQLPVSIAGRHLWRIMIADETRTARATSEAAIPLDR
jgi:hypothetical protein